MKRIHFLCSGVIAVMALASLTLFPDMACAATRTEKKIVIPEDLTHPSFKTLTVGICPGGHNEKEKEEEWRKTPSKCSRAQLMYPYYKKTPWMNELIARSIILPMLAERLDEKPASRGGENLYKGKLMDVVRKGGERGSVEKPPPIEFTAKLSGYESSSISPAGLPRPEMFGPYLQFMLTQEMRQQYDTHPAGPLVGFVVIDIRSRRILTIDDLILPGQEKVLENLQRTIFRTWMRTERSLPNEAIKAHYANPSHAFFPLNRNWRIAEGGLMFRFATYEVGPRPFGSPEIFLEKKRLGSIIQPDILKQIPDMELTAGN
ncbi:MAG: hypothetical protein FWH56_00105 [Betaproteobacteria bacterium]|nr:hypothetical protein [Betaproteobacteria bacterium]